MRQKLKISLSLLISLLLCGGFAVFSFTRLFNVVETTFFQPRVLAARESQLLELSERVTRYHLDSIARFQPAVEERFTLAAFQESNQQAQQDIFDRQNYFGKLLEELPNVQLVRFLGSEGRKIHFSTATSDIEIQDRQLRKYLDYDRTGEVLDAGLLLTREGEAPRVIIDGAEQRFIYSFPVVERDVYRGVALFYVSKRGLLEYLLRYPGLDAQELSLVGQRGIVFNLPPRELIGIENDLVAIWQENASRTGVYQEPLIPVAEANAAGVENGGAAQEGQGAVEGDKYNLLSVDTDRFGTLSLLIPYSVFQLQPIMKGVVLAAIFLTFFLLLYLIFNLRQDPVLILSQRIKRLQLDILREFVEERERIDWRQWQKKLEDNRGQLKSRIKRGIGRIPSQKEAVLDEMIDRNWDEIISLIETRVGGPQPEAPDIRHIEELLQRALEGAQLTVQAPVSAPAKAPSRKAGIVVEEIGVDEVIEPGEVIPAEEAEELEEAEAVEEAEELEEAEAVEEAEELEEAEAVEEAEELEKAEAVEEAEELEEAEAVEEAEELEEAEAVEEAEELEEAEAVEEAEEPVFLEGQEQETVEELEGVKEIVPLPPLPQEQLEELPVADAGQQEGLPPPEEAEVQQAPAVTEKAAGPEEAVEELEIAEEEAAPIESILSAGEELVMESIPGQEKAKQLSPEEIEKIQQSDERKQLEDLVASKTIRTYSLEDIEAIIMEQRSSVVMENGVYRIKEEIVGGAEGKSHGRGLMALAQASLTEPAQAAGGLESGIGALLGDESILDLETEIGQIHERSTEIDYASLKKTKNMHFFDDGLDYDEYLKGFRGGKTETDRLRSLVEFSGKLKAVNAAIFSKDKGKYDLVLKVGLNDPGFGVYFTPEEPFIDVFIKPRYTVYIGENIEKIKALSKKMHPDDLKYMQAALVFPAVFRGHESFLLLGLPVQWDLDIEDIVTRLDIY